MLLAIFSGKSKNLEIQNRGYHKAQAHDTGVKPSTLHAINVSALMEYKKLLTQANRLFIIDLTKGYNRKTANGSVNLNN